MMPNRLVRMLHRRHARCRGMLAWIGPAAAAVLLATGLSAAALADDDLPGRVGRIAEFAGHLYLAPEDRTAEWTEIGLNYPVSSGDNLWVSADGRAEVDYGGGQFRLAGDTSVHVSRLDDRELALFVAQGRVIVRLRVLDPGEAARVDAPNTQVQLTRPGLYRIDVTPDRQSTIVTVREGEALVVLANGAQQALPGQTVTVSGQDPVAVDIRNGISQDGLDTWSANRDRYYEQGGSASYVSQEMVGYADLEQYGTWQQYPDYGAVWFPSAVAPDWAPYSDGYWTNVGAWGLTWVDFAPWGYAPFHYGRWAWVGGRWGWCPGKYVAHPFWAPALVAWHGGPAWGASARFGSPVYGWLPLGWRDPYLPPWRGCSARCWTRLNQPYGVDSRERPHAPPTMYANGAVPGALTVVSGATLASARPVAVNRVRVPRQLASVAPVLGTAPPLTPSLARLPTVEPGAGVPLPASTFAASQGGRTLHADVHSVPVAPSGGPIPTGNARSGVNAAQVARPPRGPPATTSSAGPATRDAPYPLLAPNAAKAPPAITPPSPGGSVAEGRSGPSSGMTRSATAPAVPSSPPALRHPSAPSAAPALPSNVVVVPVPTAVPQGAQQAIQLTAPQGVPPVGQGPPAATGHPAGRAATGPHDVPQGAGAGAPTAPSPVGGAMNR